MFIKLFRTSHQFLLVLLLMYGLIIWGRAFLHPQTPTEPSEGELLFAFMFNLSIGYPYIFTLLAFAFLFLQAVVINNLVIKFNFIPQQSYMPAFVYLTLMSVLPEYTVFNKILIFNGILIWVLNNVCKIYYTEKPYKEVFDTSLLLGVATLFYTYASFFILFLWLGLFTFRVFSIRKWLISALGFALPFVFVMSYFFWIDDYSTAFAIKEKMSRLSFSLQIEGFKSISLLMLAFLSLLTALYFKMHDVERVIMQRKYAAVLMWLFVIALVTVVFTEHWHIHLAIAFIPSAIFISFFLLYLKKQWLGEIIILVVLLMYFANNYLVL